MEVLLLFGLFVSPLMFISLADAYQPPTYPPKDLLLVDTDGGIDDALALLLVLTSRDIATVLAVTCVFGDTDVHHACDNSLRELVLADAQGIPVHKGSPGSLTDGTYVPILDYYVGLDGLGNRSNEFPTGPQQVSGVPAAVAMTELARKYPGRITLLAVGPLTNLALAHRIDQDFTHNLKEIVIMGGNYNGIVGNDPIYPEFNFKLDPLAANIVLTEAACPVVLFSLEITEKTGIPWDTYFNVLSKINTRLGHFFQRVTEIGAKRQQQRGDAKYFAFDFKAAAAILYPEIVTSFDLRTLSVEHEGRLTKGLVVVVPKRKGRRDVKIVTGVNATFVEQLLYQMLADN